MRCCHRCRAPTASALIDFATDVNSFRDDFVSATPENIREARRYLDGLRADGSTNISGALEEALNVRTNGERLPLIVFLTDGEPTVGERDPDAIAGIAARRRGDARLFTVGVSADVNSSLIERLAIEGRGTAHFVRAGENVERPVVAAGVAPDESGADQRQGERGWRAPDAGAAVGVAGRVRRPGPRAAGSL